MLARFRQGDLEVQGRDVGRSAVSAAVMAWPLAAIVLLWCNCAHAETQVFLLRGWFGVFSTGMDTMAEELRAKGIKAEAIGHLAWKSTAAKIAKARAAGQTGRLALVGHSQGANNVIDMARELQSQKVPVDLLITLVPFMQGPVPSNVVRAVNYYQSPGWGSPLTTDADFKGKLSNIDISGDWGTFHVTIDKSSKIQAEVIGAIVELAH
jgi:hypothetical protein